MRNSELVPTNSAQLALTRTKELLEITRKILAPENSLVTTEDKDWMYRLWVWADVIGIGEETIAREIGQLTQLTKLDLSGNPITEWPKGINRSRVYW